MKNTDVTNTGVTRILNVSRLHLMSRSTFVYQPWMILGIAFAISWAVWAIVKGAIGSSGAANGADGLRITGAVLSILVYMLVVAVMAITLSFPFALGMSITRREFYLGTSLLFVTVSAVNSVVLAFLSYVEQWTGGWGVDGYMFLVLLEDAGPAGRFLAYFALHLFLMFIGAFLATIYMRWRMYGMIWTWLALGLLLIGAVALATYTGSWGAVGAWFVQNGPVGVAAWLLVPAAIAGLLGYLVLRRATPKN